MLTIMNKPSVPKAYLELDEANRMKPSQKYERVVGVMEIPVNFMLRFRSCKGYLDGRYS